MIAQQKDSGIREKYLLRKNVVRENKVEGCESVCVKILKILGREKPDTRQLNVADIGCGVGVQSLAWARLGQRVFGLDIDKSLVEMTRKRTIDAGYTVSLCVGSAMKIPLPDESVDVCIAESLLEHVAQWQACLDEFARILRGGGIIFLTTTNRLSPIQHEFNLPFYSWYPASIKRYCERLAITTRPGLANYTDCPAVNWFTPFMLQKALISRGLFCLDRFSLIDISKKRFLVKIILLLMKKFPVLKSVAYALMPSTAIFAIAIKGKVCGRNNIKV